MAKPSTKTIGYIVVLLFVLAGTNALTYFISRSSEAQTTTTPSAQKQVEAKPISAYTIATEVGTYINKTVTTEGQLFKHGDTYSLSDQSNDEYQGIIVDVSTIDKPDQYTAPAVERAAVSGTVSQIVQPDKSTKIILVADSIKKVK